MEVSPRPLETDDAVAFLRRPSSYAEAPASVTAIETHMAWVFLTDRYAYKMKKPVRLGRLDTGTLTARRRLCVAEVALNRRLAAGVYLGLCAIRVGEEGELILDEEPSDASRVGEWVIKMRRLSASAMLDERLANREQGRLRSEVRQLGHRLARFYAGARAVPVSPATYRRRFLDIIDRAEQALCTGPPVLQRAQAGALAARLRAVVRDEAPLLTDRVAAGRVVEGHGDLRPEHVCLEHRPVVIDGLEFSTALRTVDPVDELAFLSMECVRLGAPWVGPLLQEMYVVRTGDATPPRLRAFYGAFRAFQRARLAVRHLQAGDAREPEAVWIRQARDYMEQAAIRLS